MTKQHKMHIAKLAEKAIRESEFIRARVNCHKKTAAKFAIRSDRAIRQVRRKLYQHAERQYLARLTNEFRQKVRKACHG